VRVAGEADFIVSGDRHLLRIGAYEGISIVTVRQFVDGWLESAKF